MDAFNGSRDRAWSMFMLVYFEECDICFQPIQNVGAGSFLAAYTNDFNESLLKKPDAGWLNVIPWSMQSFDD